MRRCTYPDTRRSRRAASLRRAAIASVAAASSAIPLQAARVEIVLDASGSMRAAAGGTSKMEAAKQAVRTTVEALDPSAVVALRLYGHRLPSEPKEPSCEDTELVIPFAPLDRRGFVAAVEAAKPLGQTPLAHSLQQAAQDFGDLGDEPAAVILVSDGEESCGGDPAKVACAFAERGLELTVHTVGFDVDAAARAQLQAIAQCTGGEYRDAANAGELSESLRQLTQAGLLLDKERERLGQEIRGGNGFESAVPITPGTYHLDHHQRPNEFDYFSIEATPGRVLRVTQEAYEVGVTIDGDTFHESNHPAAGVAVHAPDREQLSRDAVTTRGAQAVASAAVMAGGGGTYYILIGQSPYSHLGIHKDSPITIEMLDHTDAGSGTDAGDSDREAVTISAGEHRGWLHFRDYRTDKDVFAFAAQAGATYGVRARADEERLELAAEVTDEDGVKLAIAKSPNRGAAARIEDLRPERAGQLFVALSGSDPMSGRAPFSAYTLELTSTGGAADGAETADAAIDADPERSAAGAEQPAVDAEAADAGSVFDAIPGGLFTLGLLLLGLAIVVGGAFLIGRRGSGRK